MKITYTDQYTIAQEVIGLTDAATLLKIKRDINIGTTKFLGNLGGRYNRKSRFTDLVAGQQYYQLPEDGQKLKEVIVSSGGWYPPMEQIPDEFAWRQMNMFATTGLPSHYFIKGNDELGLYPIPSATISAGIELVFSPKHVELTQADTTGSTLAVTNGSQTVTSSSAVFTALMVGQWLQVTDGTDENWYRISGYTSTTSITIENFYQGTSGTGKSFRIGQVADMPEEYLEAPADYACYRHFLKRGDKDKAATFSTLWTTALAMAKEEYGNTTDSQVINAEPQYRQYNPWRGDPPAGITA